MPRTSRACIGFGHRQCIHALTAHGGQQVTLDLFVAAGHQDVLRPPEEVVQRHRAASKLALDQRELEVRQPCPADFLGEVAGIETQVDRLLLDPLGDLRRDSPVRSISSSYG